MTHHDIVIIGSGSGNTLVTPELADRDIAIVEGGPVFGGTCLNVGCIPTKMYVHAADRAHDAGHNAALGVDSTFDGARWADIRDRVFGRIDPISSGGESYRAEGPGTTLYRGWARFVGPRELEVTTADGDVERVTGDQVVIATGARPSIPEAIRASGVPVHTSDTVLRLDQLPRRLLVVGGGFIAAELAHVFSALGSRVTVVVRGPAMLRHLDDDLSAAFTSCAERQWDVRLGTEVNDLHRADGGVTATCSDGSTLEVDEVLVATGRVPQTDDLGLDAAGVDRHADGRVLVDAHGRTSADGVLALGDAASPFMLKHVANHEARVVAHNLAHPDDLRSFRHDHVPAATFTHPQIAEVGLTEAQARAAGHDVVTYRQDYSGTAYGWALEDTDSFVKLVGDRGTGALLGAHILGPHAATLVQPLIQALALGTPPEVVAHEQYWIHPALTEVVENALIGLVGLLGKDQSTSAGPA